jgi:hypothetical protein
MPTEEENLPKYVTAEDLAKAIDAKLGAWSKTFEKKNGDTIKSALGELGPQLDAILEAKLEAFKKPAEVAGGNEGGAAGGAGAGVPPAFRVEDHPAFKGMQRQLESVKTELTADRKARLDAEAASRSMALKQAATEQLAKYGIRTHVSGAWAVIKDKLKYSDEGKAIAVDDDGSEFTLPAFIETFSKAPENKIYVDPRGAGGSGGRPVPGPKQVTKTNGADPTFEDIGNMVLGMASPIGTRLGE